MDRGRSEDFGKYYALGVPDVTALPSGRLLVLERELNVTNGYMGSEVVCKLFLVDPTQSWQIDSSVNLASLDPNKYMIKKLLLRFTTQINPFRQSYANYEACVWARSSPTGRQTLLMVSDLARRLQKRPGAVEGLDQGGHSSGRGVDRTPAATCVPKQSAGAGSVNDRTGARTFQARPGRRYKRISVSRLTP